MRVAYLVSLFPKISETFVLNEVVELQRRGIDIQVISCDRSSKLQNKRHAAADELTHPVEYAVDGLPAKQLQALCYWAMRRPAGTARLLIRALRHPAPRDESRLGRFLVTLVAARLVRRWGSEHLHAHWSYPCDVGIFLREFLGLPLSFTAHAHDIFDDVPLYEAAGFAFHRRVEAADFVVACTAYNRDTLRGLCPPEQWPKLHHAYHGLDLSFFAPSAGEPQAARIPQLVSVGRFVPYKGFDVIARAAAVLRARGYMFHLRLAGPEGSLTPIVHRLVAESGLEEHVELMGPLTQDELRTVYRESDIFINASDPEGEYGVANVIVEALASGLATVATHRPQVDEYLESGVTGVLIPYGDVDALADAVAQLIDEPDECRRLGNAGRALAERRFAIGETADRLAELFAPGDNRLQFELAETK
jgi:glycosyltransferase involved in cell wall biosynthesis